MEQLEMAKRYVNLYQFLLKVRWFDGYGWENYMHLTKIVDTMKPEEFITGIDWIPVSKELPKEDGEYEVTYINLYNEKRVVVAGYNTKRGFTVGPVTAWKPVSKPYEGDAENEKEYD